MRLSIVGYCGYSLGNLDPEEAYTLLSNNNINGQIIRCLESEPYSFGKGSDFVILPKDKMIIIGDLVSTPISEFILEMLKLNHKIFNCLSRID